MKVRPSTNKRTGGTPLKETPRNPLNKTPKNDLSRGTDLKIKFSVKK